MTQELLDGLNVSTSLQFMHSEGMTQSMGRDLNTGTSFARIVGDNLPESLPREPLATPIKE